MTEGQKGGGLKDWKKKIRKRRERKTRCIVQEKRLGKPRERREQVENVHLVQDKMFFVIFSIKLSRF